MNGFIKCAFINKNPGYSPKYDYPPLSVINSYSRPLSPHQMKTRQLSFNTTIIYQYDDSSTTNRRYKPSAPLSHIKENIEFAFFLEKKYISIYIKF